MSHRKMESCYDSTRIPPWSTDQMKITFHATTIIHYGWLLFWRSILDARFSQITQVLFMMLQVILVRSVEIGTSYPCIRWIHKWLHNRMSMDLLGILPLILCIVTRSSACNATHIWTSTLIEWWNLPLYRRMMYCIFLYLHISIFW